MKKPTKTTPALVLTPTAPVLAGGFTIGLDLGDRNHYVCALAATGQLIHEGPVPNDRAALTLLLTKYPAATVALETGTHSPWISRYLTGLGATVIVANPRPWAVAGAAAGSAPLRACQRPESGLRLGVS